MARKDGKDRGITFKDGKWWVRLFANGREKWYRAENKTQAKALYGRLKADLREEKYFPEKFQKAKALTLRTAIARHLEGSTNRNLLGEKTYGRFWTLLWGKRLVTDISTEDCRSIQAKLSRQGNWKPATINRYVAFLRHVLMMAVTDGKLTRNPVSGVKFFPESNRVRFFSDNELLHLHGLIDPDNWKVVAFALETGLRRDEQFSLRWSHITFEAQTLTIPLPKGGRTRHVPLSVEALEILRSLDSILISPYVFAGLKNPLQPMDSRAFMRRSFEPALRKAGIQDASWHTLRHTTASRLAMAGVPIRTIQEILGHRDIGTTLKYAHLAPGHIKEAIQKGSLANLGLGTGSKTGSDRSDGNEDHSQVVDLLARPTGLEPVTLGSEDRCSIH